MLGLVLLVILLALIFDYVNGMHDAANSIATVVSTRVLSPLQAVVMAAIFNASAVMMSTHVANAIGKETIKPSAVDEVTILAALVGAITWNLLTWWMGLPSSSSHALIGGLVGAGVCHGGFQVLVQDGLKRTILFIFLSPMIGFALGALAMVGTFWTLRHMSAGRVDRLFRRAQLFSAAFYSFGHGSNDAQKTMGIIALVLYRYHLREAAGMHPVTFVVPTWVRIVCNLCIGLGTLSGGWRIVKTMGSKICKLRPVGGFCAETAGAVTLMGTAMMGIPVSTTHTITGAIMGVGSTQRLSAVRWGVAQNIIVAWILTIPAAGLVGYVTYAIIAPIISWLHLT